MNILQSDDCLYNKTDASSITFIATLIVHAIFLFEINKIFIFNYFFFNFLRVILLIWCVICFFCCLFHIEDVNHKNRGIYSTVAKDAPENGINYMRIKDYILMGWNFCQLFSYSFLDEFSIKSSEDSLFSISWLDNIIYYIKFILLQIGGLGDLVLFFLAITIIFICIGTILYYSCYYNAWFCSGCGFIFCSCLDSCSHYIDLCCKGYKEFFKSFFFFLLCGTYFMNEDRYDNYVCNLCCMIGFYCDLKDNECMCCGCNLRYNFFKNIPFILKTIIYDFLYIPILSSLIKVFVCTYTCDYNSSIMNKEEAYPPLDAYTSISCNSSYTIICFILSFFAIAFYHIRASYYICYELDKDYSGDVSTNQRFQYIQMIGKFVLTVISTMFYFQPFVPLSLNLIIFIILLIVVIIIPARTAFTMEHSRLYVSLYTVQVLAALMALLSQIFSSYSSFFSLLTICLVPFGFIFGWGFFYAPSWNGSYPYSSLTKMISNKDPYIQLLVIKILLDEFEPVEEKDEEKKEENDNKKEEKSDEQNRNQKDDKKEKDNEENKSRFFDNLLVNLQKLKDYFAFGSIFHNGFSLNQLIIMAEDILIEMVRYENRITSFERDNTYDNYTVKEISQEEEKLCLENYRTEVINTFLSLIDYEYHISDNTEDKHTANSFICSIFIEHSSFILSRDNYIKGKSKEIKIIKDYKKYKMSEILEELLSCSIKYLKLNNRELLEKITFHKGESCLLSLFYYPNSIIFCLPSFLYKYAHMYYTYLFYDISDLFILYSYLIITHSILNNCKRIWGYDYDPSLFYLFGVNIEKHVNILLSYVENSYSSLIKISIYNKANNISDYNKSLFETKHKVVIARNIDKVLNHKFSLKILSLLSSLFKNNWRFCAFFSTFINEEEFVDTIRNSEEYEERKKHVRIEELCDIQKNDLWLLNREKGKYDELQSAEELYVIFDYDKKHGEEIISGFEEKESYYPKKLKYNKKSSNCSSIIEELKEDEEMSEIDINNNNYSLINRDIREQLDLSKEKNENERIYKRADNEEGGNDSSLEESLSESSLKSNELEVNERDVLNKSHIKNQKVPEIIDYILLCLYSESDDIREYSLLALLSLLDREKNNEEYAFIEASVLWLICKKLSECLVSYALYYNIKYVIEHQKVNIINNNSYINKNLFIFFDEIVEYTFNSNIKLSSDEEKRIIQFLCTKEVIEWISSFYDCKGEREKVIRLLYILISCSEEDTIASLFNFEEYSVFLLLFETNETENYNIMSFFSSIQIMESFLKKREKKNIKEEMIELFLSIIILFLYKIDIEYIYIIVKEIIEKYYLFDNDLSNLKVEGLKEELLKYIKKEWYEYINNNLLSLLPLSFSDTARMKRENKMIICDENCFEWETCVFDKELKKVFLLSFELLLL